MRVADGSLECSRVSEDLASACQTMYLKESVLEDLLSALKEGVMDEDARLAAKERERYIYMVRQSDEQTVQTCQTFCFLFFTQQCFPYLEELIRTNRESFGVELQMKKFWSAFRMAYGTTGMLHAYHCLLQVDVSITS